MIEGVTHAVLDIFCSYYAVISAISYVQLLYHVCDLSDNCFSDNDIKWNSEEDYVISCGENDNLWEEFQQSTFWSPLCSIKQCYTSTCDNVEDKVPLVKLYLLHIYDFFTPSAIFYVSMK